MDGSEKPLEFKDQGQGHQADYQYNILGTTL